MELRNTTHILLFVLLFIQCQTLEQTKSEDVPMNVNLGQHLVGRKNASEIQSTASPIFMEGGSLNKTTTQAPLTPSPSTSGDSLKNLLGSDSSHLPDEMVASWPSEGHDKNSSSKPRKGAPICSCCVNITIEEQLKNCTCCPLDFKIPISSTTPQPTTKSTTTIVTTPAPKTEPTSTSKPSVSPEPVPVMHHKKPNVTADVPDPQVPAQQQDYVIPVVGIIFAVPLIIILGALVYKKGADLWERRHYRRMDFLIDGIYNNQ